MDPVAKLRALASLRPTRRRRERAAAVMLRCDEAAWAQAREVALSAMLLTEAEAARIGRVRRCLDTGLRWQFVALTLLDAPASNAGAATPPDDPEAGKTWLDPDAARALLRALEEPE